MGRPEELSGIWEAPDGTGGAVGLNLMLTTTDPSDVTSLTGVMQSWDRLTVGLYQRSGPTLVSGEASWFEDSPRGGGVVYEDGRLRLRLPRFDVDLRRSAEDQWVGRLHRKSFDANVTLKRPEMQSSGRAAWYVGTWKNSDGVSQAACTWVWSRRGS